MAVEFANSLCQQTLPSVTLVDCYQSELNECVVVDIEPEVPQHPVYDIRYVERVAIMFPRIGNVPVNFMLRRSFPAVPHASPPDGHTPCSLCVTEESPAEQLRKWTPERHCRLLHRWLALTARGELHPSDQPLEPFLMGQARRILLPSAFFQPGQEPGQVGIIAIGPTDTPTAYLAYPADRKPRWVEETLGAWMCLVYNAPASSQNLLHRLPTTLSELGQLLNHANWLNELSGLLDQLHESQPEALNWPVLLIIRLPKVRTADQPVEAIENWVFAMDEVTGKEFGEQIGHWEIVDGQIGRLLRRDTTKSGESIRLMPLLPSSYLTPDMAAWLNGRNHTSAQHFLGIGAGALGSQFINNQIRAGLATWTLIDNDLLLGHNLSRHYLSGRYLGRPKVEALSEMLNETFEEATITYHVADVMDQPLSAWTPQLLTAVIDLSASVAVGRYIAQDSSVSARRMSLFLNPAGSDLVLLAESADRGYRLDCLEMDYYRALLQHPTLHNHLFAADLRHRYSYACRDISSRLPQDRVALFAAIGANAARLALESPKPSIQLWQATEAFTVSNIQIEPTPYTWQTVGDWTLCIADSVKACLIKQRQEYLPNETGGILIGTFDMRQKLLYIIDTLPSPPDSHVTPSTYQRGIEGVKPALAQIRQRTLGHLEYVGEWHSHPDGCSLKPSTSDQELFSWQRVTAQTEGVPPCMAIVGEHRQVAWYVDTLPS